MTIRLSILNGPNLNMLGVREPGIYGAATLADIEADCRAALAGRDVDLTFRQTNSEGELVGWIQEAASEADGIIINPAGYTHTSVAVHDALRTANMPIVELHLSNVHAREDFRKKSYISPVATAIICGFGPRGYVLAVNAILDAIEDAANSSKAEPNV